MSEPFVKSEKRGRVIWVTLNRPEVMNALHPPCHDELEAIWNDFAADPELWVAVLTGAGERAFSAGNDLKWTAQHGGKLPPMPKGGFAGLTSRFDLKKPVIAAVNGVALGGGFEIVLACDLVVAADGAQFGLPEPRVGMLAQYGLDNLSRMIPLGEALRLQLTGEQIDGRRAYDIGLVQELAAERDGMLAAASRLAEAIAKCSPTAVRTIRHVVTVGRNLPAAYAELFSQPYRDLVHNSAEALEGTKAFLEKRPPRWVLE